MSSIGEFETNKLISLIENFNILCKSIWRMFGHCIDAQNGECDGVSLDPPGVLIHRILRHFVIINKSKHKMEVEPQSNDFKGEME